MEDKIKITFIRHGATKSNLESRYLGWKDEQLSEEGIKLIKEQWSKPPNVQQVFCSPMVRCIQTGKAIFGDCDMIEISDWKEINFGDFEGKNYKELAEDDNYQKWIDSNGTMKIPKGESREEFIKRVMKGLDECIAICHEKKLRDIACVVHGGTIMAIASSITGKDYYSFQVKPGQSYTIEIVL
ncbi:MAG: histidine phosphatase family protein [Lachnospiraceae bacterium]|nr:histidine phosphatase family protein [Lachnospiraceae bacterium]